MLWVEKPFRYYIYIFGYQENCFQKNAPPPENCSPENCPLRKYPPYEYFSLWKLPPVKKTSRFSHLLLLLLSMVYPFFLFYYHSIVIKQLAIVGHLKEDHVKLNRYLYFHVLPPNWSPSLIFHNYIWTAW